MRVRLILLLLLCAACDRGATAGEWPTDVVRAAVRRAASSVSDRRVVIRNEIGEAERKPIPWSIEQAVVTAGFAVNDSTAATDSTVLVWIQAAEQGEGRWYVTTEMLRRTGAEARRDRVRWAVQCTAGECTVTDSTTVGRSSR